MYFIHLHIYKIYIYIIYFILLFYFIYIYIIFLFFLYLYFIHLLGDGAHQHYFKQHVCVFFMDLTWHLPLSVISVPRPTNSACIINCTVDTSWVIHHLLLFRKDRQGVVVIKADYHTMDYNQSVLWHCTGHCLYSNPQSKQSE